MGTEPAQRNRTTSDLSQFVASMKRDSPEVMPRLATVLQEAANDATGDERASILAALRLALS